jgi:hypothetical protein
MNEHHTVEAAVTCDTPAERLPAIRSGSLHLYRFFEIGDAIDLAMAQTLASAQATTQSRPARVRHADSIHIAEPPLRICLRHVAVELAGIPFEALVRASVYGLGVVALALVLPLPPATEWDEVADLFAAAQDLPAVVDACFQAALDEVEALIRPAISRPDRATLVEDYSVLMVERLVPSVAAATFAANPRVRAALLGERRALSNDAAGLVSSMSYYLDDLALLSWNGALIVEPDPMAAATVRDLLEFANVELLLLRSYEAALDVELSHLNQRIAAGRRRPHLPLVGRYSALLRESQHAVLEVTEVTERIDNAFKVTDDVYWNRLYSAILGSLRVHVWRAGLDHRLRLLRESYGLLRDQAESDRSASFEVTIILLIVIEIVLALVIG